MLNKKIGELIYLIKLNEHGGDSNFYDRKTRELQERGWLKTWLLKRVLKFNPYYKVASK